MKIALIGATGMAGSRILEELVSRGHYVKAIARDIHKVAETERVMAVALDLNDHDALVDALKGQDAVISSVRFHGLDANALLKAIYESKVKRYIVVGGAGSLHVPHQNVRLIDTEEFPEAYRPEAEAAGHFLDKLKQIDDLDWTYISPSAEFGRVNVPASSVWVKMNCWLPMMSVKFQPRTLPLHWPMNLNSATMFRNALP